MRFLSPPPSGKMTAMNALPMPSPVTAPVAMSTETAICLRSTANGLRRRLTRRLWLALLLALLSLPIFPDHAAHGAQESLTAAVERFLITQTRGLPGKVSIAIGELDPRLQVAPCSAYESFLPPGTRLWGRATIGVRCLAPSPWTIYVPVQIRVVGDHVVTARPLNAGQTLAVEDLALRSGDLTVLPTGVLTSLEQAAGKVLRNTLGGGQPLRSDMLLAPFVVQQGQDVRLVTHGRGFSVSSEGKALNNASEGQVARARAPNGQTVSGIARSGGIIEVTP